MTHTHPQSIFFTTLCAALKTTPKPTPAPVEHVDEPEELPVVWDRPDAPAPRRRTRPGPKSLPRELLAMRIYAPPAEWAWTDALQFNETEPRVPLSSGIMCSAFVKSGIVGNRRLQYVSKLWLTNARWHGFFSELALYKVQLKSLQGRVVPTIINVYSSIGAIDVAMVPPHHSFWIEASPDMPTVLKKRCIRAYEQLHAAGVLHGDVELRHMLIGGDARVTIIDFQESRALVPNETVQLGRATKEEMRLEMRKVKYRLDFDGARDVEDQKAMRSKRLARRNAGGSRECPLDDDVQNPPVGLAEWEAEWHAERPPPRRFVMPGQSPEDLEKAVEEFLAIVEKLEKEGEKGDASSPSKRQRSPEFKLPTLPSRPRDKPSPRPPKRKVERDTLVDDRNKRVRVAPEPCPVCLPPPLPSPTKRKRAPEMDVCEGRPLKRLAPAKPVSLYEDSLRLPTIFRWIENIWRVVA